MICGLLNKEEVMKLHTTSTIFLRTLIAAGYLLMCLLAVGIMYLWFHEWWELEALEAENRRINGFRQEVHHVLRGNDRGFLFWAKACWSGKARIWNVTISRRMAMDSLLCRFKTAYPAERIDSVRHLLESKEALLRSIVKVLDEQESLNRRIAERVPVIAARSAQEQPQKPKRKGFLGLFGKKEKPKPTTTTTMLHALNRKEIALQQAQSRRLVGTRRQPCRSQQRIKQPTAIAHRADGQESTRRPARARSGDNRHARTVVPANRRTDRFPVSSFGRVVHHHPSGHTPHPAI